MSAYRTQKVILTAGQQGLLVSEGMITVTLQEGVVEIAGVVLGANKPYSFRLQPPHHCLVMYTLEGGAVQVGCAPGSSVEVLKSNTTIAPVITAAKRDAQKNRPSVVAVIGSAQCGKTHTAHTFANVLTQAYQRQANPPTVYVADLNGVGSSFVPGTATCVEMLTGTSAPEVATPYLWPGYTASPQRVQCSFWLGLESEQVDSASMNLFLHVLNQTQECCDAFARNKAAVVHSGKSTGHVIYDLPSPSSSLPKELFYKRVLDLIKPTTVIIAEPSIDAQNAAADRGHWVQILQEDLARTMPGVEIMVVRNSGFPSSTKAVSSRMTRSLREYLEGTIDCPLAASKIVAPLSSLRWLRVRAHSGEKDVTAESVVPSAAVVSGTICALSHALLDVEAPLANIAGVVYVSHVDEAHDECVLVVPCGDDAPLPNNVLVLPPAVGDQLPWKVTDEVAAFIEGSITF